jgi:hypothetical protein
MNMSGWWSSAFSARTIESSWSDKAVMYESKVHSRSVLIQSRSRISQWFQARRATTETGVPQPLYS